MFSTCPVSSLNQSYTQCPHILYLRCLNNIGDEYVDGPFHDSHGAASTWRLLDALYFVCIVTESPLLLNTYYFNISLTYIYLHRDMPARAVLCCAVLCRP